MSGSAQQIIDTLKLERHPEGGWFREVFRDSGGPEGRGYSTAIYFMLELGDRSHWHRVDAAEVWHFYAGAALELSRAASDGVIAQAQILGNDLMAGQRPQIVVPKGYWQSAQSLGEWTLVGCTVAPGFQFDGFELAVPGWTPG